MSRCDTLCATPCAARFGVKFKLNSTVTALNWQEDMSAVVNELQPSRWKVFQMLLIAGENDGGRSKRDAHALAITSEQFQVMTMRSDLAPTAHPVSLRHSPPPCTTVVCAFSQAFEERHRPLLTNPDCMVMESNDAMRNSYVILDEKMRFLNNTGGRKDPTESILDVGVATAFASAGFDEGMFFHRGGVYAWTRDDVRGGAAVGSTVVGSPCSEVPEELEW